MIPSQMLKGTLEGCILGILSQKETYGYEISSQLAAYGFGTIPEGTIYPLLLRLEKNGLVSAAFRPLGAGAQAEILLSHPAGERSSSNSFKTTTSCLKRWAICSPP